MRKTIIILTAVLFCYCGQLDREELLDGNFGNVERSAPVPLSPVNNAITKNLTAEFVWAPQFQAMRYELEIAADESFSAPIFGSPFGTDKTSLQIQFPDDKDYYWRLRANTTRSGIYSEVRRVRVLGNVVRVFCPQEKSNCGNEDAVGNKSAPYEKIQPAVNEALNLGLSEIQVAARGGGAFYTESTIYLQGGINILAGYDAATWSRNISGNSTEIHSASGQLLLASGLNQETLVEGFILKTTKAGAVVRCLNSQNLTMRRNQMNSASVTDSEAHIFLLENCTDLILEENILIAGDMISTAATRPVSRILTQVSGSSVLRNNTAQGSNRLSGNYGDGTMIEVTGGAMTIEKNTLSTGNAERNYVVSLISSFGPINVAIEGNQFYCQSPNIFSGLYCVYANTQTFGLQLNMRGNMIEAHSYATPVFAFYSLNSVTGAIENNVIITSGNGIQATSTLALRNNSLFVLGVTGSTLTGITSGALAGSRELRNNIVAVLQGTTRRCIDHGTTGNGFSRVENNNFFGCSTAVFRQNSTDYPYVCADGKPGTTSGCSSGVNVATTSTAGNVSIDNDVNQLIENMLKGLDVTEDGPDGGFVYDGTVSSIEVPACNTHGQYIVGEYIEYDRDGIAREITAVNCTASTSTITFSPALAAATERFKSIRLWGSNSTNLTIDARLKPPATTATCNVVYGGLNLSSNFTVDREGGTRTASLPSSGVCNGNVTNAAAAGWSMGAYEKD